MKIPLDAKRVFKGVIFDVYQWQQKVYDDTYKTFEMLKRVNSVEVIATSGKKIFLSHQSQPNKPDFYSLFGGRAEDSEDSLATATRELIEESGLSSDTWELFKVFEPIHKIEWQVYTYIARDCKKIGHQKLDSGERIEIMECSFDQFIEIVLSDTYWGNELVLEVLRMKDNGTLDQFKNKLFR